MSSSPSHAVFADAEVVEAIARAVDPPYALLVRLLRHTALRWSEAVALQRKHCHPGEAAIDLVQYLAEYAKGPQIRPLSRICGRVHLDKALAGCLAEHLERHVGLGRCALVFSDDRGGPLLYPWFEERQWLPALRRVGLEGVGWGVDSLQTARVWSWIRETQAERAAPASSPRGDASGWRRP